MTFRKINIDNRVKYIPRSELTQERDTKLNTIRSNSNPRKQTKNNSQNNRKFFKNIAAEGFGILK